MLIILSLLLFGVSSSTTTLRWSKDAGEAPTFHHESDGSVTAIYKIMEGTYSDIEPYRRRLAALTPSELRTKLLDKHNELRAKTANGLAPCKCGKLCGTGSSGIVNGVRYHPGATNMNSLFWDDALERVAQQYSDKCLFIHNKVRSSEAYEYSYLATWTQGKEKYMGENLYISSTGSKVWNNIFADKDYGIEGGLEGWWNECIDFQLSEGGSCGDSVGHYTQYIRADSRFVGCGVTICPSGVQTETATYSWANMNIVCNYAGGQYGDVPYDIAETNAQIASNCEPDRIANFNLKGLCGGPQAKDWFENPQKSYDKTSFPTSVWICDDGTGRDICEGAGSGTPNPTPYPTTSTTTKTPTNNPLTPQPSTSPITPTESPTNNPSKAVTPEPTKNIVTATPTKTTPSPITPPPTRKMTRKPTSPSPTTPNPSVSPLVESDESDECDLSDCTFSTNIQWKSRKWKYQGFVDAAWKTEQEILGLQREEKWGGKWGYSWGGQYRKDVSNNTWILYIWDDIDVDWLEMECSKRQYFIAFMQSLDFEEKMKLGILGQMGSENGEVTDVTVTISCDMTASAAFGEINEDSVMKLPFSTWNLNTYTFSDWFVLLFVLFTGGFCFFGCGYLMHRRHVFKAMEEASIGDFQQQQQQQPIVNLDGGVNTQLHRTENLSYLGYDDINTSQNEIQIGVSVNSNKQGFIEAYSDDDNL